MLIYVTVAIAVLVCAMPMLSARTPGNRQKALDRYASRMNLALTPEAEPTVAARVRQFELATFVGGLVGVGFGVVAAVFLIGDSGLGGDTNGSPKPLTILVTALLGAAIGAAVGSTRQVLVAGAGPRLARARTPRLEDYVPWLERWGARLAVGGSVLTLAGGGVALATGVLSSDELTPVRLLGSPGAVCCYLGVLALAVGELVSRRILKAGQPSRSQQDLAWNDALRASALRGLTTGPVFLGVIAIVGTVTDLGTRTLAGRSDLLNLIGGMALIGFMGVVIVVLVIDLSSKPQQHYWRRLWAAAPTIGQGTE